MELIREAADTDHIVFTTDIDSAHLVILFAPTLEGIDRPYSNASRSLPDEEVPAVMSIYFDLGRYMEFETLWNDDGLIVDEQPSLFYIYSYYNIEASEFHHWCPIVERNDSPTDKEFALRAIQLCLYHATELRGYSPFESIGLE